MKRPCSAQVLFRRSALSALIGIGIVPHAAHPEPLALVQYPAGTMARRPAPNVVLTLDDSGSMAGDRMTALKDALAESFKAANVPDGSIRLGWNGLNRCRQFTRDSDGNCQGQNRLRVLDATQRGNFLRWVRDDLEADGGTPTHAAYQAVGEYFETAYTDLQSPWAARPGTAGGTALSCRRAYSLVMTDGGWNHRDDVAAGGGNADGTSRTLGDGSTVYDTASPHTRLYRDGWGIGTRSTFSDLVFHYWATDLQPGSGMGNDVPPRITHAGEQTFTSGTQTHTLPEFWNPKNDPATWQHLNTYTIGFGDAARWGAKRVTDAGDNRERHGRRNRPELPARASYPAFDGQPQWGGDTWSGDLPALVTGARSWPDPIVDVDVNLIGGDYFDHRRRTEMWHGALNGRGKFIPAETSQDLVDAFRDIIEEIMGDNSSPLTSAVAASTSLARAGTLSYAAGYDAEKWKGFVSSGSIAARSGTASANAGWNGQTTADKLDALPNVDSRLILTWRTGSTEPATLDGAAVFKWADDESRLSDAQKRLFHTANETEALGRDRLNHLRGDRSRETSGTPLLRARASRQGDIVNSRLWYVAQPAANHSFDGYARFAATHASRLPMLYVGGNDGMLHGFSGEDGSEKIAYVPKGVMADLPRLTRTDYDSRHRYFVDGSPFSGDVNQGTRAEPDWRTLLVGTLGAGGKGYFVLDVTRPGGKAGATDAAASNFQEAQAAELVFIDRTAASNASADEAEGYIGHIVAPPVVDDTNPYKATQITRLNNGKWAAVLGNGSNSTLETPALLIQYLDDDDRSVQAIPVPASAAGDGNGLSAPRLVDLNGDGRTDVVYAGDLQGNLWKFDLLGSDAARWATAFDGAPLFTAVQAQGSGTSLPKPITAAPVVRANARGATGLMVAFGTGRNLTEPDRSSTGQQTLYAVLDSTTYRVDADTGLLTVHAAGEPLGSGLTRLVRQSVTATPSGAGSRSYSVLSANAVAYDAEDAAAAKGWYFHLPETGERLLDGHFGVYDGTNILEVETVIPATGSEEAGETCTPHSSKARYFRTFINIMDGRPPSFQIVDLDGNGLYNAADQQVSRLESPGQGLRFENVCGKAPNCLFKVNKRADDEFSQTPILPLRPNWRQLR